jgi:hypothetical protein
MPGVCPSGWQDNDLKIKIEKEFSKHKEYSLANSLDKADLVFLAEGEYSPHQQMISSEIKKNTANVASKPQRSL